MNRGPLFLCYVGTPDADALAKPGAVFVTGSGNRNHVSFQRARELGAEVWMYANPHDRPNSFSSPLQADAFMGDVSRVPLWGNNRSNWKDSLLTDIRPGSAWSNWWIDDYMSPLMAGGTMGGAYLDGVGCRLFSSLANWLSWPLAERQEWTAGNVDLVRRLDARRLEINPHFVLHTNNLWVNPDAAVDASHAEQYIDGVSIESPPIGAPSTGFNAMYCRRPFANRGRRRVSVIADTEAEAQRWATFQGVTHVTSVNRAVGEDYQKPTRAVVPYVDGRLAEERTFAKWFAAERVRLMSGANDAQLIEERDTAIAALDAALADLTQARTDRDAAQASLAQVWQAARVLVQLAAEA